MNNMRIAITGTIGSGKTTVSGYLREKGFYVFDADECNRSLLEKGNDGFLRVKESFPECFTNGDLDKKKLSSIIFSDKRKKALLESLLHPLILIEMYKEETKHPLFFAEIPLLFETGYENLFEKSLLIVTDNDVAIQRLLNRGMTKDEAESRISNQMAVEEKLQRADRIIYNNADINSLFKEVNKLLEELDVR